MKLRLTNQNIGTTALWDSEIMGGHYDQESAPEWHVNDDGHRVAIFEQSVGERLADEYDGIEIVDENATQLDTDDTDDTDGGGDEDEDDTADGDADEPADEQTAQTDADSAQDADETA